MNDKTILKYLQGRASEKERGEIILWIEASEENRAEFEFQRRTVFSAIDEWNVENGYDEEFSIESVENYLEAVRGERINKDVSKW